MAITPPTLTPKPLLSTTSKRGNSISGEQQAQAAEREWRNREVKANQNIEETRRQEEVKLDQVKDEYIKLTEEELARQENSVENQKNKGYEQLRRLKAAQQAELARTRREGENDLLRLQEHYRRTIHNTDQSGEQKLQDSMRQHGQIIDHQVQSNSLEMDHTRQANEQRLTDLKSDQDSKYQAIFESSNREYERLRNNTSQANEEAREKFQTNYKSTIDQQQEIIANLNNKASDQVRTIRRDTAGKLAAYTERQEDPFYQMKDLGAELKEYDDRYVLTAQIPEHEQKNVTATVKGGNIVISGNRKSDEKLTGEDGSSQSTSTFQSYNESFPIDWPVEMRNISKAFEGDTLIVSVPKKGRNAAKMYKAKKPEETIERIKVEKPKFPENLPHVKSEPMPELDAKPLAAGKKPGSTTLT